MTSGSAPCACTTKAGPKDGASAGMCLAPIISTTCAIRGAASRNTRATSITSRRRSAGPRRTTSRRIRSIYGGPTSHANSRSIARPARADCACCRKRSGSSKSLHDDFDLFTGFQLIVRAEPVEHAEAVERVIGRRHAMRHFFDRIVGADCNGLQTKRPDLLALLQGHSAEGHDGFAKLQIDRRGSVLGGENKAVDVAAKTHRVNAKRPISTAGRRGRRLKAIDGKFL